jgi:hypothetical protein
MAASLTRTLTMYVFLLWVVLRAERAAPSDEEPSNDTPAAAQRADSPAAG